MDTVAILQQYIMDELLMGKKGPVGIDQSLISSGILNSLTLLQLIAFIERRFDLQIAANEMTPDNFQTISVITRLIEARRNVGDGSMSR